MLENQEKEQLVLYTVKTFAVEINDIKQIRKKVFLKQLKIAKREILSYFYKQFQNVEYFHRYCIKMRA
jgi:hypothetical protein